MGCTACAEPQCLYKGALYHAVTEIINCCDTEGENEYCDEVFIVHPQKLCRHNSGVRMEERLGAKNQGGDSNLLTVRANENFSVT